MQPASFGQAYTKEELSVVQKLLERRLRPEEIAWREGPNEAMVPYLPADWVVNEANRIFGRDGWASSVSQVTQDFLEEVEGKFSCGYSAVVRVTLRSGAWREDIGYGVAHRQPTPVKAIDTAKKVAVSDGLKRAMRQCGSGLGNGITSARTETPSAASAIDLEAEEQPHLDPEQYQFDPDLPETD